MRVDLLRRRWTDREAAVYARVIAVIQGHYIHEDNVAGLNQTVGAEMWMGIGAVTGRYLHVVYPLGT